LKANIQRTQLVRRNQVYSSAGVLKMRAVALKTPSWGIQGYKGRFYREGKERQKKRTGRVHAFKSKIIIQSVCVLFFFLLRLEYCNGPGPPGVSSYIFFKYSYYFYAS
jgi:hypothetical protein